MGLIFSFRAREEVRCRNPLMGILSGVPSCTCAAEEAISRNPLKGTGENGCPEVSGKGLEVPSLNTPESLPSVGNGVCRMLLAALLFWSAKERLDFVVAEVVGFTE